MAAVLISRKCLALTRLSFSTSTLPFLSVDVKARNFAFPAITDELHHRAFRLQFELIELKEVGQDSPLATCQWL